MESMYSRESTVTVCGEYIPECCLPIWTTSVMGRVGLELKVGVWSGPALCMLNHLFLFLGIWLSSGIGGCIRKE